MSLAALHAVLAAEGGLLGAALSPTPPSGEDAFAALAASGPRAQGDPGAYALVVTAIREGYLLHYGGGGRDPIIRTDDVDLALLAGDRLYALGLERLADLGDLDAVEALADVIALCARAQAAGDPDLAEAVWEAGATQVGWGDDGSLSSARSRTHNGDPSAGSALRAAARQAAVSGAPDVR